MKTKIERLDWRIPCGEKDEHIGLLVLSVLHTFAFGEGQKIAKDVCFQIIPDKDQDRKVHGITFSAYDRKAIIVLINLEKKTEKEILEIIAHELGHYILGHHKLGGPRRVSPENEDSANQVKEGILDQYYPEIKRLLEEADATTLRELFFEVYPEDIKKLL